MAEQIEVRGLRDLRKALKQVEDHAPKELRDGLAEAAEIVAGEARQRVVVRSGRARDSIKVRKQSAAAALAVGGSAAPYYPWLDFGGRTGRGKATVRPFIPGGRYVYPALKDKRDEVVKKVDRVVADLAKKAGFETHGTSTSN